LLISLYVEDHLLLAESMMCIDNVLVMELTIMLKNAFSLDRAWIDEVQSFAVPRI